MTYCCEASWLIILAGSRGIWRLKRSGVDLFPTGLSTRALREVAPSEDEQVPSDSTAARQAG